MPTKRTRLHPILVILLLAGLPSLGSGSLYAQVWPVRLDTETSGSISVLPDNPLVLVPYQQKLSNDPATATSVEPVPTAEIALRCGDGDGCLIGLFQFGHQEVLATAIVRRSLFTTADGMDWRVFDADQSLGSGTLDDDTEQTLVFTGGLVGCSLKDGDVPTTRLSDYFLQTLQPAPGTGTEPIVDCLLRIDD